MAVSKGVTVINESDGAIYVKVENKMKAAKYDYKDLRSGFSKTSRNYHTLFTVEGKQAYVTIKSEKGHVVVNELPVGVPCELIVEHCDGSGIREMYKGYIWKTSPHNT